MPTETKSLLQNVLEESDRRCREYSGHGMEGKTCLGVELSLNEDLGLLFADVLEAAEFLPDTRDLQKAFRFMRTAASGAGCMIVYFPDLLYVD